MKLDLQLRKWLLSFATFILFSGTSVLAQPLSGTYTIPGSYGSIQAAVDALNLNGVNGAVTFNIGAGSSYTEQLTGTIVLGSTTLNSSVSATNTITFQRAATASANPIIYSYQGFKLASSTDSIDGMFAISGTDWVTIDGIDLIDTNSVSATTMMEFGYGLYKASATDGVNNVTIRNCVIILNRNNIVNPTGTRVNVAGSTAIDLAACLRTAVSTTITPTAVSGASSNNKFYSNTIQNCNIGISLVGAGVASPYTLADTGNDIGGISAATGNTIINFGGGTGAANACAAAFVSQQYGANISYNTINNNNGTGVNHPTSNRGIWLFANSPGASCNVNNNIITIKGGANAGAINWCIDMEMAQTGANGNVLNMNNNQFLNCVSSLNTTVQFTAIWVNSAATIVNVNNNYIYGFTRNSTTGTSAVILSQLAGITTLNINNNIIDSFNIEGVFTTHYGIGVTAAATNLNMNNNTITRITFNSSTTGAGTLYPIYSTGATTTNANGNTVHTLTRNGTTGGTTIGIYILSGTNQIVKRNTIHTMSITGTGATSTMYGIQTSGTTVVCDSNLIYNLNIAKTSGTGALYGIYNISSPNNENFNYNTIYNLTNIGTGLVYGIYAFTTTGTRNVSYNTIYNLTGNGTVNGLLMSSSVPRIFNNKIYNLTTNNATTGIVSGIAISSTTAGNVSIHNNLIGNLFAPNASNTTESVRGINITATTATTTFGVYYNTIYLNATSTGANFSTSGIFHTANATSTTASLDLRNNIIVNLSTPAGSGVTAALRRSAVAPNNYLTSSNRNLFYAGVPAANRAIYFNGTALDSTLADFKLRFNNMEQASITENPTFISTTGSSADFLHLDLTAPTQCESGGGNVTGITNDFDNVIRFGNTGYTGLGSAPDIGADEGDFTGNPMVLDSIMVDQNTAAVPVNASNQHVVAIRIHTTNSFNALVVNGFKLNTSGTTNVADIQNARVYFTGNQPVFSTANAYGNTVAAPNGTFYINGTRVLSAGVNYFWVTYDTKSTSIPNNFIDVRVDSVTIGTTLQAPVNGNPTGARRILGPLSGNYNVGAGQTYPTITAARNDLNSLGVSGAVTFILKDTLYNASTGEIFPIVWSAYQGSSNINTVTVRPDSATSTRIESSTAVPVFELNGINNLIIDGRQRGSVGFTLGSNLILSNATTTAPALRFINDASNNRIIFTDLRANNQLAAGSAEAGVVNFNVTNGANGNDNNIIRYCHIHENGGGFPVVAISSLGSGTTTATHNDGMVIDSNEIYNFYHASSPSVAVYIGVNNNNWQINGNRFYQTGTVNYTAGTHRVLWITPNTANLVSGSGFIIHNNFFGGASGTGAGNYTVIGASGVIVNPIDLSVGLGTPTSVQGNIFTNFNLTMVGAASNNFMAINMVNGNVNCGTTQGNLIGSRSINGAITFIASGTNAGAMGIRTGGGTGNTFNISNNIISGWDLSATSPANTAEFFGINLFNATNNNCTNNMIGDTGLVNSIQFISPSTTSTYAQRFSGIFINPSTGTPVFNVNNNIICNLVNQYNGAGTQAACTRGILLNPTIAGTYNVNNNSIFNIYTASRTTGAGLNATLGGIVVSQTVGVASVNGNTIQNLNLTSLSYASTTPVQSVGLFYSTATTGNNIASKNQISAMGIAAVADTINVIGIQVAAGNGQIFNNIIRLGMDSLGTSVAAPCSFIGINKTGGSVGIYFNSVYIGGNASGSSNFPTYAFYRSNTGTDIVRNNIFVNSRSNLSGNGKNYAIAVLNPGTTFTLNNNVYHGTGTGYVMGRIDPSTDVLTYTPGWTAADMNSAAADPRFINPMGSLASANMRISTTLATPVEGSGFNIATITDDIDGQLRSGLTPTDIGADAGNFVAMDVFAPVFGSISVSNTASTGDRTFNVSITDATGMPVGTDAPRVYFKKFAAGAFQSAAAVRASGTAQNGVWNFTIPAAAMSGLTVGDSVYFFLVAQDSTASNNMASLPGGATGTVNIVINNPSTLFAYRIVQGLSGNILVGNGQTYPNLTGNGGFFEALNNGAISANLTVTITSDLLEDGTHGLNPINESGVGGYMVNIVPDGTTERVIAGSFAGGLIRLNGADRVRIDGRFNGSGRYLRFRNRVTGGHTIQFLNDAQQDTITYCFVESINNTVGTITFSTSNVSGGSGNDNNGVTYCMIGDTLGTPAGGVIHNTAISSAGTAGLENDNNFIAFNEIYNFGFNAINLNATGTGNNWVIANNAIYMNQTPRANVYNVIFVQGGSGHLITQNSMGGSAPNRSGAAFATTTATTPGWFGINVTSTGALTTVIRNNTFSNISGNTRAANIIQVSAGTVQIRSNVIGGGAMPYDTIRNGFDNGIINISGGTVLIDSNLIGNVAYYGAAGDRTSGITVSGGTVTITNNTLRDIVGNSSGTAFTFLITGMHISGGTNHIISNNSVSGIRNTNNGASAYTVVGINITSGTNLLIERNRIYNIWGNSTGTGAASNQLFGIYKASTGGVTIINNQISLGQNTLGESRLFGIQDVAGSGITDILNNSIFISGQTSGGSNNSYGIQRTGLGTVNCRNNILYNNRSTLGNGFNYALGTNSLTGVDPSSLNYNLLIVNDTTRVVEGPLNFGNSISGFNTLYTGVSTYSSNWYATGAMVPVQNFFVDTLVANLNLQTNNALCWYAHGKGLAQSNVSADFNGNARSTTVAGGATDIGAHEFTTSTQPPLATASAAPSAGTTTTYSFGFRPVASIVWGSGGTIPTQVNIRYYSGVNAPNLISGRTRYNAYVEVAATGGSGFTATPSFIADAATLGTVASTVATKVAMYDVAWNLLSSSSASAVTGMMTTGAGLSNLNRNFTGTDGNNNPLPVELTQFIAKANGGDVMLYWNTASEQNNKGFYVERSIDGTNFKQIGFVRGFGNSTINRNYQFADPNAFEISSANTLYYRLQQVDFDGAVSYSTLREVSREESIEMDLAAYPNPFTTEISLQLTGVSDAQAEIEILDLQGSRIMVLAGVTVNSSGLIAINNLNGLNAGIYFVKVKAGNLNKVVKVVKH